MKTFWLCFKNKFLSSIPYLNLVNLNLKKERKKHVGGKKKEKKKIRAFPRPSLELTPFMLSQLSNTVYQRTELT